MYASECRSRCVLGGTETNIGEGGRGCGGGAMCWAPAKRKEKKKSSIKLAAIYTYPRDQNKSHILHCYPNRVRLKPMLMTFCRSDNPDKITNLLMNRIMRANSAKLSSNTEAILMLYAYQSQAKLCYV